MGFGEAHRVGRDAQFRGHLAVAEALQVEQEHRVPLAVGQAGDRGPDPGREVGQFRELVRARAGRDPVGPGPVRAFRAQLPEPAPGNVQRDAAEPGTEPVCAAQPVQPGHRGHHCFLDRVAGQVLGAQDAGGQGRGHVLVAAHQFRERLAGAE